MSGTSLVGRRVCRLDPPAEPPSELEKAYEERGGVGLPDASIPFHVIGRDLRTHHFLPAVLAVLLAASTATFARTAQTRFWFTPDLAPYRTLIELYREGSTEEAVEGVLAFDAEVVHRIADTLRNSDMTETGTDQNPALGERLSRAAAMLHVDAADELWSNGLGQAAMSQIEVGMRWADLAARNPEPEGAFRRRWYLGVALLVFERGGWHAALSFVDRACDSLPDDVPLLTTAAWLNEQVALAPVDLGNSGERGLREAQGDKRDSLLAAARRARAAVTVTPDATEAALRLARAHMLLEETDVARGLLLGLVDRTDVPTPHAYLARLMLGRLYAQAAEPERAERLFREASALIPQGQAARMALSRLLESAGDRSGAAVALEPILTVAQDDGFIEPWVDYLLGVSNGPDLRGALRDEVRQ